MDARPGARESPLVRMATLARRPSRWWVAWLIALVIIHFVAPLGTWVGRLVIDPTSTDAWFPYVEAFPTLAVLLALYLWVRLKEGRPFSTLGFRPGADWIRLLPGLAIGIGLAAVAAGLGLASGDLQVGQSVHALTGGAAVPTLLPVVVLTLWQAAGAQAISSGYMVQSGARQMPGWVAVLAPSVIAASQQTLNPVTLFNLVLFGVLTALVALQQGSLWLVIGLQAGWFYAQDSIFGLPRAGITDPAALWSIGPTPGSSTTLSGGPYGLVAGLLASVVLTVAVAGVCTALRLTRRTAKKATRPLSADRPA